ncbi:MAG: chromate transporter [Myxococcales bacterium]|jgi:chromate transporter|nr:chromate transporter [Myxococcales bacterium]
MRTLALLCVEFSKTGLFAVGGGMATLPFLYDMAARQPWFTPARLTDMIALAQAVPGPIGVNMAAFAGFAAAGIPGGIVATLALVAPTIVVITLIARFMGRFAENQNVAFAFYGLRPAVLGLIAAATFEVFKLTIVRLDRLDRIARFQELRDVLRIVEWIPLALFAAILAVLLKTKCHPALMIVAGAGAGILLKL